MTVFDRQPRLRWAVPGAAAALIMTGALVGTAGASADSGLPVRTPQELLVSLQTAEPTPVVGTVRVTADLGLPELPGMMGNAGTDPTAMISGTHTLRVWSDGADRARVAMIGNADEYDIIRNGTELWTWSSSQKSADKYVISESGHSMIEDEAMAGLSVPSTPAEAADLVLAGLDDSTDVTTSGVGSVAGRPVYELVLTPRQSDTRVARAAVAIDAETNAPLRVRVYSTQMADPAFEVGFTSVDFTQPDPELFDFTPPPGATVTEHPAMEASEKSATEARGDSDLAPVVIGDGWGRVVLATIPPEAMAGLADGAQADGSAEAMAVLQALPETSGPWGTGRVLDGTLGSAILTDDGRIAIGAVGPKTLGAALASQ